MRTPRYKDLDRSIRSGVIQITAHIAQQDLLGLYREGQPDYKQIAELVQLSKTDLSKLTGVAKSSVRSGLVGQAILEILHRQRL